MSLHATQSSNYDQESIWLVVVKEFSDEDNLEVYEVGFSEMERSIKVTLKGNQALKLE